VPKKQAPPSGGGNASRAAPKSSVKSKAPVQEPAAPASEAGGQTP
jgi:hypothetical protein